MDGKRQHVLGQVVGDREVDGVEVGEDRLAVGRREVEPRLDARRQEVLTQLVASVVDERRVEHVHVVAIVAHHGGRDALDLVQAVGERRRQVALAAQDRRQLGQLHVAHRGEDVGQPPVVAE